MGWSNAIDAAFYLLAGLGLGAVYFTLLMRSVRLHAAKAAAVWIVPLYVLRFAAAAVGFWFIAQQGAFPLLLSLLGFLGARFIAHWKVSV